MAAEILGLIRCPHCGNEKATVHRNARGKSPKLYYRCYAAPGSVEWRCGTVQISGPKGQEWIKANMKPVPANPLDPAGPKITTEPKGSEPTKTPPPEPKGSEPEQQTGTFGTLFRNFVRTDDE